MKTPAIPPQLERALATWSRWRPALATPPVPVRQLQGGLSNSSWLVESDAGPAVVRLNSQWDDRFNIDRRREQAILAALAGEPFLPEVWYCAPERDILVSRFVQGDSVSDSAVADPAICREVGEILARLQRIDFPLPRFDYWGHLCHYRAQALALGREIPQSLEGLFAANEGALQQFQRASWKPVLVHHDLTPANLIVSDSGLVLLDWEYAAMGYGGMDLVSWLPLEDPFAGEVSVFRQLINGFWALLAAPD